MQIHRRVVTAASLFLVGLVGCGGPENTGPPKSVDFTKNYTPAAKVDFMNPNMQKQANVPKAPAAPKTP
jgi:hypothetical protein